MGGKKPISKAKREFILARLQQNISMRRIAREAEVSVSTIHKLKNLPLRPEDDMALVGEIKRKFEAKRLLLVDKYADILLNTPPEKIDRASLSQLVIAYGVTHDKMFPPSLKVEHEHKLGWMKAVQQATTKRMRDAKTLQERAVDAEVE